MMIKSFLLGIRMCLLYAQWRRYRTERARLAEEKRLRLDEEMGIGEEEKVGLLEYELYKDVDEKDVVVISDSESTISGSNNSGMRLFDCESWRIYLGKRGWS